MKNKILFIFFVIFIAKTNLLAEPERKFQEFEEFEKSEFEDVQDPDAHASRFNYFRFSRLFNDSTEPSGLYLYNQLQRFLGKQSNRLLAGDKWQALGPFWVDIPYDTYSTGNGRVNCVRLVPGKPGKIFIGTAAAGIWVTEDYGKTWKSIAFTDFVSLGVSDISICPSNPDVIYAALGDKAAGDLWNCYSFGIIKSTDGGVNWKIVTALDYDKKISFPKLEVDPDNPDVVTVASSDGLLRSDDGGIKWDTLREGYYKDFEYKPDDRSVIYASTYDVFGKAELVVSKDGGKSWNILKELDSIQRVEIAVTSAAPDNIYIVTAKYPASNTGGFYISRDGGLSWDSITTEIEGEDFDLIYGQGFYNLQVNVSPIDTNQIYAGGVFLFKLNKEHKWDFAGEGIHVDQHGLTFDPVDSSIYAANDGGIYRSKINDSTWENLSKGLNITQFYRIGVNGRHADMVWAGAQDMGTFKFYDGIWEHVFAGDGMQTVVDDSNPNTIYTTTPRGYVYRTTDGGLSWDRMYQSLGEFGWWHTSFVRSGSDPEVLLIGQRNIWKSEDKAVTWQRISNFDDSKQITAIAISKTNPDVIIAARENIIYKTVNRGISWNVIDTIDAFITSLVFDSGSNDKFWITCGRFTPDEKVLYYDDSLLQNYTYNLPDIPINCLIIDNISSSEPNIFIGTDIGVFTKSQSATEWSLFDKGIPNVIINEFEIDTIRGKLYAATFSRGLWEYDLKSCDNNEYKPVIKAVKELVLCKGDVVTAKLENPEPGYEYFWSNGAKGDSSNYINSGDIYVTAFAKDKCPVSSSLEKVIFKIVPKVNLLLLSRSPLCPGDTAKLTIHVSPEDLRDSLIYTWSNGFVGDTLKTTVPDTYYVTATSDFTCPSKSNEFKVELAPVYTPLRIIKDKNKLIAGIPEGIKYIAWFVDGVQDTTLLSDTILPAKEGVYRFEILDSNYCDLFSESYDLFLHDAAGDDSTPVQINPNPFNNSILVELFNKRAGEVEYKIYDVEGKNVFRDKKIEKQGLISVNINNLNCAPGVYYLQIKTPAFEKTIKLMKIE